MKTWGCGGLELWKNGTGFSEIANILGSKPGTIFTMLRDTGGIKLNRPGFPGECFICELRLPDHRFRWKH
ncbi:hypothetical protein, partial [Escherichia coli]|uniref:hypothetical protein n=1 Tax=Escherichia coli TaxID=562 RepID=UPI0011E9AF8B